MKIVVIGGSGLTGNKLVQRLHTQGHETISASSSSGVNTVTGAGLDTILMGAQVAIDVTNTRSFEDAQMLKFFETSTYNILNAEAVANVKHHVILSVVGADQMPDSGYMRAKVAQENMVRASTKSFTIVRATQYFEFLDAIANVGTDQDIVSLPPAFIQPIAVDDVAEALVDIAVGTPGNNTVELAGPERFRLNELIQKYLNAIQDPREVIGDPSARYFGATLDENSLIPGKNPRIGATRFEQWLEQRLDRGGSIPRMKS